MHRHFDRIDNANCVHSISLPQLERIYISVNNTNFINCNFNHIPRHSVANDGVHPERMLSLWGEIAHRLSMGARACAAIYLIKQQINYFFKMLQLLNTTSPEVDIAATGNTNTTAALVYASPYAANSAIFCALIALFCGVIFALSCLLSWRHTYDIELCDRKVKEVNVEGHDEQDESLSLAPGSSN